MTIENGTYRAKASGACVLGTSKAKGTPFIELYFKISGGEADGKLVRWTSYFTDNTSERTIQALVLMGWQGDDLSEFEDGTLHGLDSNEVDIVVENEEFTTDAGETRQSPRVQWVNRPGGRLNVEGAMNTAAAKTFSERMRGLVLNVRKGTPVAGTGTDFPHGASAPQGGGATSTAPASASGKKAF